MSVELVLVVWLIGLGCLILELFVTSITAGIIGVICFLGSIVAMFLIPDGGVLAGGSLSLVTLIAGGVIIKVGAARMTHKHVMTTQDGYVGTDDRTDLIGQTGTTATTLRPGGFATIGGKRIDVVTNGEMIDAGTPVEVVAVEGNRVQVRIKTQSSPVDEDRLEFRDIILALLENALDEAQAGTASAIAIELAADRVKVTDNGRGLPVHPHPQSARALLEVIMTGARRGPRNTLARINSACLWVDVEVHRDGALYFQRFEYARPTTDLETRGAATRQGTSISCAPAIGEAPSFEAMRDYLRTLAEDGLAKPVKIRLIDAKDAKDETIIIEAMP